jgi:hypothetical protein
MMPAYFGILEDDQNRIDEMRSCITEVAPSLSPIFFDNAFEMVDWLKENLAKVSLISLDHDLPLITIDGASRDCGDGRLVADYLAQLAPTCPIIVHSSNADCAAGMFFTLERAGWRTKRTAPFDGITWIRLAWKQEILDLINSGWLTA